jgi:hypothetical protein
MCCITFVMPEAMATTQFLRAACCEICWAGKEEARVESRPPRMNWVVVTDEKHNHRMQMRWAPSADNR